MIRTSLIAIFVILLFDFGSQVQAAERTVETEGSVYSCRAQLLVYEETYGGYINEGFQDFTHDLSLEYSISYRRPYLKVEDKGTTLGVYATIGKDPKGVPYFDAELFRLRGELGDKYFANPWRPGNDRVVPLQLIKGNGEVTHSFEDKQLRLSCRVLKK